MPHRTPSERLADLGVALPEPPAPAAAYVPSTRVGELLFTSGQLPLVDGALAHSGHVGQEVTLEQGVECARLCAVNALAVVQRALGDLERVAGVVKATVFVAGGPDFVEPHRVADGASTLLQEVFHEAGRHARSAVTVAALPLGAPVEVELVVRTRMV